MFSKTHWKVISPWHESAFFIQSGKNIYTYRSHPGHHSRTHFFRSHLLLQWLDLLVLGIRNRDDRISPCSCWGVLWVLSIDLDCLNGDRVLRILVVSIISLPYRVNDGMKSVWVEGDIPEPPTTPTVNPCPLFAFKRNLLSLISDPLYHRAWFSLPSLDVSQTSHLILKHGPNFLA